MLAVASTIGFALSWPPVVAILFIFIGIYRMVNILKLQIGIANEHQLRATSRRSSLWLISAQIILFIVYSLNPGLGLSGFQITVFAVSVEIFVALLLIYCTRRSLQRMHLPSLSHGIAHRELPTVTVAIPARNESEELKLCLETLVRSNYPKLEIIVLDDCSQNKRTPEIIRQFAHSGVRFLAGKTPPDNWLAKNFAYQQLFEEANGEYLLFCGVDTRFNDKTITRIIEGMIAEKKDMISIMPSNQPVHKSLLGLMIQPVRYAWEISLPRVWSKRPPVLSTCWVAKVEAIHRHGGFGAVKRTLLPERFLARALQQSNSYAFYRDDPQVGLSCLKQESEQLDTALRTRYPQFYKKIELVCLATLLELVVLATPLATFIYAMLTKNWSILIASAAGFSLMSIWYFYICTLTYRKAFKSILFVPFMPSAAIMTDSLILNRSMWNYEFSEVIWKGRNICIPVMQVYPELPKLK